MNTIMKTNLFYNICVIGMAIICFSCSNSKKYTIDGEVLPTDNAAVITIEPTSDTVHFSKIVKSLDIIPLESKDGSLMGSIESLKYNDSLFFCLDYRGKQIYSFDAQGNFRCLVGTNGRGHGEYLKPNCIGIDTYNKQLLVLDNGKNIKRYDYEGNFISSDEFNFHLEDFVITPKSLCLFTSKRVNYKTDDDDYWGSELTIVDRKNHNSVNRYIPVNKALFPADDAHVTLREKVPFGQLADSYTFHYNFTDLIYSIDKKTSEVKVKYVVDFGKNAYKDNLADMGTQEALEYIGSHSKKAGFVHDVMETDNFLMFNYVSNSTNSIYFKSKTTNKSVNGYFVDDIFDCRYSMTGYIDSNRFFAVVEDPSSLKFKDGCNIVVRGKEKTENLKNTDNPLILIFTVGSL